MQVTLCTSDRLSGSPYITEATNVNVPQIVIGLNSNVTIGSERVRAKVCILLEAAHMAI